VRELEAALVAEAEGRAAAGEATQQQEAQLAAASSRAEELQVGLQALQGSKQQAQEQLAAADAKVRELEAALVAEAEGRAAASAASSRAEELQAGLESSKQQAQKQLAAANAKVRELETALVAEAQGRAAASAATQQQEEQLAAASSRAEELEGSKQQVQEQLAAAGAEVRQVPNLHPRPARQRTMVLCSSGLPRLSRRKGCVPCLAAHLLPSLLAAPGVGGGGCATQGWWVSLLNMNHAQLISSQQEFRHPWPPCKPPRTHPSALV